MKTKKVIIGLSGGVDSSVAAWLLQQQGYAVEGLFMINWKDSSVTLSGDCSWEEDVILARLVAKKLGIPLHVVDTSEQYRKRIVDYMFREYENGRTPNPDVLCNREIKFDVFIIKAGELGADFFATGHYCRKETVRIAGKEVCRLLAGADINKDQSYFLCQLNQSQLKDALFPVGHLLKPEVRKIAAELDLATAARKDSQGICFVGKVDLPTFLQQQLKPKKGDIIEIQPGFIPDEVSMASKAAGEPEKLDILCGGRVFIPENGVKVGEHQGAWYFTVGQRKGLDVGGTPEPLFVIGSDTENNILYVGQGKDHPGLFRKGLFIADKDIHWIRPDLAMLPGEKRRYPARVRYRQALQAATLYRYEKGMYMVFDEPQRGITPGQFAAWYDGDELLGSGVIG
ncbi:MAG: tRNA 2-thiouridine(34) synthase MnmA [Bacteroidales bacterium]|nr:tRNA 2-thiouridine(34) synthase MnmA [Bacteroidales bacterium]